MAASSYDTERSPLLNPIVSFSLRPEVVELELAFPNRDHSIETRPALT